MKTDTIRHDSRWTVRKTGYAISIVVIALIVGPVVVIGAYTILTSVMSL